MAFISGAVLGTFQKAGEPKSEQPPSGFLRFVVHHPKLVVALYLVLMLMAAVFLPARLKWPLMSILLGIPAALALKRIGVIDFQEMRFGTTISYLVATIPFLAYGVGQIKADDVLSGRRFEQVMASSIPSISSQINASAPCNARVVGRLGNSLFVLNVVQGALTVVHTADGDSITTKPASGCETTPPRTENLNNKP